MKKVYIIVSILFFSLMTFAQSGTQFMDNRPWQEVLQRAQRENKLIFVIATRAGVVLVNNYPASIPPRKNGGILELSFR